MDNDDMLLAYFQRRLSTEDTKRFEARVKSNPEFAAEVAALSAARNVFADEEASAAPDGWSRLSGAIDEARFKPANQNTPIRLSLPKVAGVAVAAVLGWQLLAAPLLLSDKAPMTMASSTIEGPSLQLVFTADASLTAVSKMLYELEGTIVDGPTALGVYHVRFGDAELRDVAIKALEKRSDLVKELLIK